MLKDVTNGDTVPTLDVSIGMEVQPLNKPEEEQPCICKEEIEKGLERVREEVLDYVFDDMAEYRQRLTKLEDLQGSLEIFSENLKKGLTAVEEQQKQLNEELKILKEKMVIMEGNGRMESDQPSFSVLDNDSMINQLDINSISSPQVQQDVVMFTDEEVLLAINSIRPKITRSRLARELVKLRLPVHLRGISNCSGTLGKKKIDQALLNFPIFP